MTETTDLLLTLGIVILALLAVLYKFGILRRRKPPEASPPAACQGCPEAAECSSTSSRTQPPDCGCS